MILHRRADLWKDIEMPGFRNGIDMNYPTLDKAIKERVMTTYVPCAHSFRLYMQKK